MLINSEVLEEAFKSFWNKLKEAVSNNYQKKLTAGSNIKIENNTISCDVSTMNFKGSVNAYSDLPASADVGDAYNVVSDNTNYCWNGTAWSVFGNSVSYSNLLKQTMELAYPIGCSYIQPPNCPPPTELFPDFTWEEINLSGAFLRFNGGNAQAYESQSSPQAAQAPNITGKLTAGYGATNKSYGLSFGNGSGAFAPITSSITQDTYNGGSYVVSGGSSATFDSSLSGASTDINGNNIYKANGELRPINYTFRLWRRKC